MPSHLCLRCGVVFNSQRAKDMHKRGSGAVFTCRDEKEMKRIGMNRNSGGKWRAPALPPGTFSSTSSATAIRFARTSDRFR